MEFKTKVRKLREELFLTQEALAKEIGVSFATINRWEGGRIKPSILMEKRFNDYCKKKNIRFDKNSSD